MTDPFADWYVNTVDVDTITGVDDWGAATTEPHTDVPCWIEWKMQQARDQNGTEVLSTSVIHAPISTRSIFTAGSQVNLPDRTAVIITVAAEDVPGDPLSGVTAYLT